MISGINGNEKKVLAAPVATCWAGRTVRWTDAWEMLNKIKLSSDSKSKWKTKSLTTGN